MEHDHGHGRVERRSIRVANGTEIGAELDFPGLEQVARVERHVFNNDKSVHSHEVVWLVTSLSAEAASTQRLAGLVRGHWEIENCLHYVRDWTWDEDRSQVRKGSAPRTMASLRNLAIGVLRRAGATNIAKETRWVARAPERALGLFRL